jgi:acid stress chaperone HdeB
MGNRKTVSVMANFPNLSRRTITIALTLFFLAWNLPARAQVVLDLTLITCAQYMGQDKDNQDVIAAWMSGYFNAAKNQSVLNLTRFDRNRKAVEKYCKSHKPETLMSAIQRNAY